MFKSWIISKQARHLARTVKSLYHRLISFDFDSFHLRYSSPSTEGYLRDPECVWSVLWGIFTAASSYFTFLFLVLLLQPPLYLLISFSSISLSFIISRCPSSPLVHLPCHTKVRVKGQLPGRTTEPVLEGAVMYPHAVFSSYFISPDNSFSTGDGLTFTCSNPAPCASMCVHACNVCVFACVGGYISVSSSPLPAPVTQPCVFALLSSLLSSSLPCLTTFSLCLPSFIDSQS